MEQSTFQPGDSCLECQQLGLCHRLRTFYIDVSEQIIKCESSECLYPYENDFSDEEQKTAEDKSFFTELNSVTSHTGYDDADSVRFVDDILDCANSNIAEMSDIVKKVAKNSTQTDSFDTSISFEYNSEDLSMKTDEVVPSLYAISGNHKAEGTCFIDTLFSNCKSETARTHCTKEFENKSTTSLHDMAVLNFDFSNIQAKAESSIVEKGRKPQIEIQCIQTVKAGFSKNQNEDNKTNMPKVAINSLELIKTEYLKPDIPEQLVTKTTSETKEPSGANGETTVRISRYFDALKINQKKLQKTRTKPTSLERRKRQQKLDVGAGRSLVNVLQVLKTRSE